MRVDLFDFELPEASIALRPAEPRDAARLLVVRPGAPLADRTVRDLPDLLRAGDALVFNDTRVIPARLNGVRTPPGAPGQRIEVTLHLRESADALARLRAPGQAAGAPATASRFGERRRALGATVVEKGEGGEVTLAFDLAGADLDAAIAAGGAMPLPPYIAGTPRRGRARRDRLPDHLRPRGRLGRRADRRPALHAGAAGGARRRAASRVDHVTLHVGAGTFLPVKADDIDDHRMHAEIGEVSTPRRPTR